MAFPDTIESVGSNVFYGCTSLTYVGFNSGLTNIGSSMFYNCKSLTEITIPTGVVSIGGGAFENCTNLTKINLPTTLKTIDYYAFRGCTGLTSINIPDSVTGIEGRAFYNCTNLNTVKLPLNWNTTYVSGSYGSTSPFYGCTSLTEITVPEGVTAIPDYAFSGCSSLETVVLPEGLTTINQYAFSNSGIRSIEFPNSLLTIGNHAFSNCTKMNYLVLPDMIKSLSDYAFYNCIGLRSITMGSSLTTIGKYTFYGCDGLVRLYLGDNIETLSDYSFADCINLQSVVLPENLKTIGNAAFYNCPKITSLTISNTVTSIADNAFNGIKNLTFYCSLNSYAATYAIDHNIPIIDTEEYSTENSKYIDYQTSYYKVNGDGVSASGYLAMVAKYTFNDNVTVSNITLTFNVPAAVELEESTLTVDGTLCTNYTFNNGILSVPVSKTSGVVRFLLKPLNYDLVTAYSKISFYDGSRYQTEILGTIYTEIPILSIIAPNKTSSGFVEVSGVTMPNCKVTLYVNGSKYTTVTSNKVGDYSATIKFSSLSDGKKYRIQAEVIDDLGTVITSETSTIYKASVPELTEFIMEYGGKKYNLLELKGTKPNIIWASSYKYKFTVRFNNAEGVSSVYITSTRNNVKKFIQATWSDSADAFIAEGYFDNNSSYVPGIISLQYTNKTGNASFADGFDFNSEEAFNDLPEEWKNSEFVINENTEDKTDIIVDFPEDSNYDDGGKDYAMHYTVEKLDLPSNYTVEDAIADGYTKITDVSGVSKYIRQTIGSDKVSVNVIDVPDKAGDALTVTSFVMDVYEAIDDVPGVTLPSGKNFTPVKDGINIAGFVLSSYDTIKDVWKIDQIQQQIKNSNMSQAEKDEAMTLTHLTQGINFVSFLMRGALFVAGTLSFAGAGLWALAPIAALTLTGLVVDMFDDFFMETLLNMSFTWAIDPSGFVYDAETGKPILDATVTAYWIPFDEEDSDYWNTKPNDEEYGVKWESTAFSQENPLTTDLNGWYAWDVPEGWWRVKCERYGYETMWSEWLPVPPPQTSVNISMIPLDNCGYCGENVIWSVDDNGVLTISGEGEMYDYSNNNLTPWSDIASSVKEVIVEDGVTSIGQYAFNNCENLSTIKLASTVKEIGGSSFGTQVTVYCYTNSFAHSWCVEKSQAFVLLDEDHKEFMAIWNVDGVKTTVTYNYGSTINMIEEPKKIGYTFAGWQGYTEGMTMPANDVEFTAKWIVNKYSVTWNVDGQETTSSFNYGTTITAPTVPTKNGYIFTGWTPSVPEIMPAYDLTFTAVFEKNADPTVPSEPVKADIIKQPTQTTINYGDAIILHVDTSKIPEGGRVEWTADNGNFKYSANGDTCRIEPNKSGSTTFTATIYDTQGNAVAKDEQTMTSKAGFFDKIIAFFKKLFGLTKVIQQSLNTIY